MSMKECDYRQYKQLLLHKFLRKDSYTCFLCKPNFWSTESYPNILVDMMYKDLHDILGYIHKLGYFQRFCNVHYFHKAMDYMGHLEVLGFLYEKIKSD